MNKLNTKVMRTEKQIVIEELLRRYYDEEVENFIEKQKEQGYRTKDGMFDTIHYWFRLYEMIPNGIFHVEQTKEYIDRCLVDLPKERKDLNHVEVFKELFDE